MIYTFNKQSDWYKLIYSNYVIKFIEYSSFLLPIHHKKKKNGGPFCKTMKTVIHSNSNNIITIRQLMYTCKKKTSPYTTDNCKIYWNKNLKNNTKMKFVNYK